LQFCKKNEVGFFHLDNATTGLRNIYFFDTPGEDFRRNNIILRVRESRQNVWVDDWCEVTLKCRTKEYWKLANLIQRPKRV
jgi:inorganic triphosphatase YgiF